MSLNSGLRVVATLCIGGPRFVSISPRRLLWITHGEIMTCSSDGNPQPTYHWTAALSDSKSVTHTTFIGAELVVDVCNLTAWNHRSETRNCRVAVAAAFILPFTGLTVFSDSDFSPSVRSHLSEMATEFCRVIRLPGRKLLLAPSLSAFSL